MSDTKRTSIYQLFASVKRARDNNSASVRHNEHTEEEQISLPTTTGDGPSTSNEKNIETGPAELSEDGEEKFLLTDDGDTDFDSESSYSEDSEIIDFEENHRDVKATEKELAAEDLFDAAAHKCSKGWKIRDACAQLLYIAKGGGISDKTFGKLLKVCGLIANVNRHDSDKNVFFPDSYYRLKSFLKIDPSRNQKVIYICPASSSGRRKGETEKVEERCGWRLRPDTTRGKYRCDSCEAVWGKKELERDGNHFITIPIHKLLEQTMGRYGKYTSILPAEPNIEAPSHMVDVIDGQRFRDMKLKAADLAIILHSDGAEISKSTTKKLYLTFMQCVNIPLHIRIPVWSLQSVWVGQDLVKDRECFLVETSQQLKEIQRGNPKYQPVRWIDMTGEPRESDGFVLVCLADAPEHTALSGKLSHSAKRGCPFCLQIATAINHRICYEYVEEVEMKTHEEVLAQARIWEDSTHAERKSLLAEKATKGFKRPSVMSSWENFDMIKGFSLDIMHQFDEGVTRFLLEQLMEKNTVLDTWRKADQIDKKFLSISVTGHNNRDVRSLKKWKVLKAHELRFFIQHAAPYVTQGFLNKPAYKVFCLASRIAWNCTKDSITPDDVAELKLLCHRLMVAFQEVFGVAEMKYSIHLVSHLWYAVELYGPLHVISCYGPEDQIGKITRNITGMNNTTKHIMNNFVIYSDVCALLENSKTEIEDTDDRVLDILYIIQGGRLSPFVTRGQSGQCFMIGKPRMLSESVADKKIIGAIAQSLGQSLHRTQAFRFNRARTELGVLVRSQRSQSSTRRNESIVMDDENTCINILDVVGVVNMDGTEVIGTFVCGEKLEEPEYCGNIRRMGTNSVLVPHIFAVTSYDEFVLRRTDKITRQLVLLMQDEESKAMLVSPPSNRFRPT